MTGWEKVIAATALAVVGLVGLNLAIWRRLRVARFGRRGTSGDGEDAR